MKIIGVTGTTGAGKTTALGVLQEFGALVIDCDAVYHELLRTDKAMRRELEARFGDLGEGEVDRKKLGRAVFGNAEALRDLSTITHRYVRSAVHKLLDEHRAKGGKLAAVDAIALLESGLGEDCDHTLAVTAPAEIRARRIMERENISLEYAMLRINAQKPDEWFRENCEWTLHNDCSDAKAFRAVCREFFQQRLGGITMKEQKEALFYERKNGYDIVSDAIADAAAAYCEDYKWYLDHAMTEREAVKTTIALAEKEGFVNWDGKTPLRSGDRVYRSVHGKALMLAVVGKRPLEDGVNIAAAHVDSPRLDVKSVPLYEEGGLALFKTHYYGGVRKYQWVTLPLELRGVVVKLNGEAVDVNIGGDAGDPTFMISDLLPHLAADQRKKSLDDAITGESLNVIVGSRPVKGEGSDRVRLGVMQILNGKYGITEEDFLSAELEVIPSLRARDVGLDRSLIGAYGHDDRVCAYAELKALFDLSVPEKTAVCILADKEEIGSAGATGMKSMAFELFLGDLCENKDGVLRHCMANSFCLSADVTNAFDPTYPEVSDKRNNAIVNGGVAIAKYTGARGKSGCNDADAETMGKVRKAFHENGVVWQTAEMGKVDQGGGGTVAAYMAERYIETVDAGVPVIAMHAPYELVSKLDCYMTYLACRAIYALAD